MKQMEKEIVEKYKKAGHIHKECLEFGSKLINPDVKIIDVVEKIEEKIKSMGGEFAFPVNISVNETAAHDTADIGDIRVFKDGDLVKLDIGVHVDGYIADGAVTVSLNSGKDELRETSKKALEEALKLMRPGTQISLISETIENIIRGSGFIPVINLLGDKIEFQQC